MEHKSRKFYLRTFYREKKQTTHCEHHQEAIICFEKSTTSCVVSILAVEEYQYRLKIKVRQIVGFNILQKKTSRFKKRLCLYLFPKRNVLFVDHNKMVNTCHKYHLKKTHTLR